jgi:hypothetical protein
MEAIVMKPVTAAIVNLTVKAETVLTCVWMGIVILTVKEDTVLTCVRKGSVILTVGEGIVIMSVKRTVISIVRIIVMSPVRIRGVPLLVEKGVSFYVIQIIVYVMGIVRSLKIVRVDPVE